MGIWNSTKKVGGTVFNFRVDQWIGVNYLSDVLTTILTLLKRLFVPAKAETEETFEEAIERLQLSDEDLSARKKEFTKLFIFYIFLAGVLFTYALYLAFAKQHWPGTVITFFLTFYSLIHSFKYHFWLFQIKNRKLGCSIKEWFNSETKNSI